MALGSLLSLAEEAWPLLQGMLEQAPSPGHARRALLMGLHASALKVQLLWFFLCLSSLCYPVQHSENINFSLLVNRHMVHVSSQRWLYSRP